MITLTCAVDDAEALSDLAWANGAAGIAELTDGCGPGSVRLVVGADDETAGAHLLAMFDTDTRCDAVTAAPVDDGWTDTWRAHATPHRAGPFDIRLVEHPRTDAPFDIVIEPGTAFGYGHPTTLLALELLATIDRSIDHVLDLGAGSGVLAIAAALVGAGHVTAIDIDPDAVEVCRANARRNGTVVDVRCGDARADPIPPAPDGYDLVFVNVTAAVQVALAPVVAGVAAPGAIAVVSGILAHQEAAVVAASHPAAVVHRLVRDGWAALVLQH